jgi:hypothetical protein
MNSDPTPCNVESPVSSSLPARVQHQRIPDAHIPVPRVPTSETCNDRSELRLEKFAIWSVRVRCCGRSTVSYLRYRSRRCFICVGSRPWGSDTVPMQFAPKPTVYTSPSTSRSRQRRHDGSSWLFRVHKSFLEGPRLASSKEWRCDALRWEPFCRRRFTKTRSATLWGHRRESLRRRWRCRQPFRSRTSW